jgi:hypothetical protein
VVLVFGLSDSTASTVAAFIQIADQKKFKEEYRKKARIKSKIVYRIYFSNSRTTLSMQNNKISVQQQYPKRGIYLLH